MSNKKGFTLIELIVTIAVMLSILTIAIVSFIGISNKKKQESYNAVKNEIITAAEEYFENNSFYKETLTNNNYIKVSLGKLVNEDYINVVTNPITGKKLNECNYVKVIKNKNNNLDFSFIDDELDCSLNSYIEVVPVKKVGELTYEAIGEKEENNEWYKINSKYQENQSESEIVINKDNEAMVSKGVVIKLIAKISDSNYFVDSIERQDNKSWYTIWNKNINMDISGEEVYAYDMSSYANTVSKEKETTYRVTYQNKEDSSDIVQRSLTISLKVDVDEPSCVSTIIGGKENNKYYCYKPALLSPICPSVYFSTNDIGSGIAKDVEEKFMILKNDQNDIKQDIMDKAGNTGVCKVSEEVKTKTLSDTIDKIFSDVEFCGNTNGESTTWTNSNRTITQYFVDYKGDEKSSPVKKTFPDGVNGIGEKGIIKSNKGTSCFVNTYIDQEPPKFKSTDVSNVYLYQYDSNGSLLGKRKIDVSCSGQNCSADVCLVNMPGSFSIRGYTTFASDSLSGINSSSWVTQTKLTDKNNNEINGCLITRNDNPCTQTITKYVSDNAGNQGEVATYTFRIGYIRNDLVTNRNYDDFCYKYGYYNKNNYKGYLQ